jgi:GNAT superfamily N-acetyltransferase
MSVDDSGLLTKVKVRPFTSEDELACIRIMNDAMGQGFYWTKVKSLDAQSFRATTSGEALIVAELARQIVGFASIYIPDNFLHHLYVDPAVQRRGVGAALLSAMHRIIGSDAGLKCQVQNKTARDFYVANGWVEDSDIGGRDELGDWLWLRITAG